MSYDLVTGDTGSKLVVTITDNETSLPVDLTGSTVVFRWEGDSGLVSKNATITNAAAGIVEYQFDVGDIIYPRMRIEVEITDGIGKIVTGTDLIELTVREQLG